ncbi:hypothetical protein ACFL3U_02530 [Pseudomonadota bacterium]
MKKQLLAPMMAVALFGSSATIASQAYSEPGTVDIYSSGGDFAMQADFSVRHNTDPEAAESYVDLTYVPNEYIYVRGRNGIGMMGSNFWCWMYPDNPAWEDAKKVVLNFTNGHTVAVKTVGLGWDCRSLELDFESSRIGTLQ